MTALPPADVTRGQNDPALGPPRLEVEDLWMTFGNNRVLRDVALDVRAGEIHALIGQNGSGKSTLAKVLTGIYTPDAGTRISVDGHELRLPVRPSEAKEQGVAVVHQSLGLIDNRSVVENVRLGRMRATGILRRIDWDEEREATREIFERLGRTMPLDAPVGGLAEEDRATVAIARAVQDARAGRGIIIFDESTRALGRRALEHFFEILGEIVDTGTAVLMITHRLEEVVDAADRVTVLRDGRAVAQGVEVAGMGEAELTRLMLGRTLAADLHINTAVTAEGSAPVRVTGLRGGRVVDATFEVFPGEVLGITGLAGSGFEDVPYLLAGVTPAAGGELALHGSVRPVADIAPDAAIDSGIMLVSENREETGLAMGMSVAENITFPRHCSKGRQLLPFHSKRDRALVEKWIERLDVRPPEPRMPVGLLSGGNAQKVVLAKWLSLEPRFLLLHEPTQAVDVGARHTIVRAVRDAARSGAAVLVAGSDENELAMLCDRVLIFRDGRIHAVLTTGITPDSIVAATYENGSRARLRQRQTIPEKGAPAQ